MTFAYDVAAWCDNNEFGMWEEVGEIWLPVNPVPASRPRVPRYGKAYYLKTYQRYRDAAEEALEVGTSNLTGPIAVIVELIVLRPKTTKLSHPGFDVDNGLKALWDAVQKTGGHFKDDKQIVAVASNKRWTVGNEEPGSLLRIYTRKPE